MSQSNTGNNKPNSPQASSQALLDELRTAADRARDERLKLARLVKHSADLPIGQASAADMGATEAYLELRVVDDARGERHRPVASSRWIRLEWEPELRDVLAPR